MLLLTAGIESCQKFLVRSTSNSCTDLGGITAKGEWYRQSWAARLEISPASCHWNRRMWLGHRLQVHHRQLLVGCKGKAEHYQHFRLVLQLEPKQTVPHGAGSELQAGEVAENHHPAGVSLKITHCHFHSCSIVHFLQEAQRVVHGLQPSRGFWGCSEHTNPLYLHCSYTIIPKQQPKFFLAMRCQQCSELGWGWCWARLDIGISPRFGLFNASSLYTGPCLQSALVFSAGLALSTDHKTSEKLPIYSFRHIIMPH